MQQPAHKYKEEVDSIHQILSREVGNKVDKQAEQEYQDDQRMKKQESTYNQNNWSSFKLAKPSDSDDQYKTNDPYCPKIL